MSVSTQSRFTLVGTAEWDLGFEKWVTHCIATRCRVTDWYPIQLGSLPEEPSLEEWVDAWLDKHREAMARLAEL